MEPPPGSEPVAVLPKHWALPDFSLVERSGRTYALADLRGKVWVADFFYTTCPGPCPMMSSRLSALQERLGARPNVLLVSVSTDPAKDTPEVLASYAERFKAGANWLFFTGEKEEIFQLANKGFKLSVVEERNNPEPITHSTKLVLVDREGFVRGFYEGIGEDQTERLLADIERLCGE
jgi:protein SCO1/2